MDYIEFKGKTKEDAITEACEYFVISSDKLDYEVVESGSQGFLGLGVKQAVIKARVKSEDTPAAADTEKPVSSAEENKAESEAKKAPSKNESEKSDISKNSEKKYDKPSKDKVDSRSEEEKKDYSCIDGEKVKSDAEKFLKDVTKAMNMEVNMKLEYYAEDGELYVELSGDDMGVLIGKRGQTLDSLQYLTSLVVNKSTQVYVRVKVDTEDYRRRRKETLENLAKNMASKAKRTKRTVSLEPMNPYERRVIHSALQSDKYVTTNSEGDEPYRRVVIHPKRSY